MVWQILTAKNIYIVVSFVTTPCSLVGQNQFLEEDSISYLARRAVCYFEPPAHTYWWLQVLVTQNNTT